MQRGRLVVGRRIACQVPRGVERPGARRRRRVALLGQRSRQPAASLADVPAHLPEPPGDPANRRLGSCSPRSSRQRSAARRLSCSVSSRSSHAVCSPPSSCGSASSAKRRKSVAWAARTAASSPLSASRSSPYSRIVSSITKRGDVRESLPPAADPWGRSRLLSTSDAMPSKTEGGGGGRHPLGGGRRPEGGGRGGGRKGEGRRHRHPNRPPPAPEARPRLVPRPRPPPA